MDEKLIVTIKDRFQSRDTDELLSIWEEENREEWSDEAFEAIRRILVSRGHDLSPKLPTAYFVQKQPKDSLFESLGAGVIAGAGAGLAAHYFAGGKLTFPIWIVAYLLVIAKVKHKLIATVIFVAVAALVSVVFGWLGS